MAISENGLKILDYLKSVHGQDVTAADIADALGLGKRSVDGVLTSFKKKGIGDREPVQIMNDKGMYDTVKYFRLSEYGLNFDPMAEEPKKAE